MKPITMLCTVATALCAFTAVDTHAQTSSGGLPALKEDLAAEVAARQAQDAQLQANINAAQTSVGTEAAARQGADEALQANIMAETNARTAADSAEAAARQAAEAQLQNGINVEAAARQAADATSQAIIANEAAARQAGHAQLQNNINAEAAARQAADAQLQANINNEAAARQNGGANLQGAIDAESARAIAAEQALAASLQGLASGGGAAPQRVIEDVAPVASNTKMATAMCPQGKVVVGGGYWIFSFYNADGEPNGWGFFASSGAIFDVVMNAPRFDNTWNVIIHNQYQNTMTWGLRVYAICVPAS